MNVDYDYAWAMVCVAKLGKYELALRYYRALVTGSYGLVTRTNAHRDWAGNREAVRDELAGSKTEQGERVAAEMAKLERAAADKFKDECMALIRRASNGDRASAEALSSPRYQAFLVRLIVAKELILNDSKEPITRAVHAEPSAAANVR